MADKKRYVPADQAPQAPAPTDELVQGQLQQILESPEFHATRQQREFLQFVVCETLAGHADEIKGFTVATRVFGRREDFDQATDPIVSIQANRLRRSLERYYLVAGQQDPLRIDIPKGTYVPTFHERSAIAPNRSCGCDNLPAAGRDAHRETGGEGAWPTVLCVPFENLANDSESNHLAIGLATELAMELARFQDIRVLMESPDRRGGRSTAINPRFEVHGSLQKDRKEVRVAVQLIDTTTGIQLWSDVHRSPFEAAKLITFQEEVARAVAGKISCEDGVIIRALSTESKNKPPAQLKTFEAVLRYYEYDQTFTPESFSRAMEALERASAIEPTCSQVWSMLGRLYGNIFSFDIPGFDKPLEKAVAYAKKGVWLNPRDQRARAILSYAWMLGNELPAARAEAERALSLNPNSLFFLDNIGYLLTLLGDWDRGPELIRKAIRLNPYYKPHVHYTLWINEMRQENYQQAHLEILNLQSSELFWDPLARAATLGYLGREAEGRQAVKTLLQLKPDFPERGRTLIGYYIKFEEIAERVIEGLRAAGLEME